MTHRLQEKLQELLYGLQEELQEIYDTAVKVLYTMGCGVHLNRSGARRRNRHSVLTYITKFHNYFNLLLLFTNIFQLVS